MWLHKEDGRAPGALLFSVSLLAFCSLSIPKWMDEQAPTHGLFFTIATYRETSVLGASSILAVASLRGRDGIYFWVCLVSLTDAEEIEVGDVRLGYTSENTCAAFL